MYYVYNKRFQPLHKQSEEEIKWLVKNTNEDDKIILGVINYNPQYCDKADRMEDDERFDLIYNPFSYWERYLQLQNFCNTQKLSDPLFNKIVAITPLPRPSVNIKTALNFLPDISDCKICVSILHNNDYEDRKIRGYKNQGIQMSNVLQIPTYEFDPDLRIISPELIFCLMALADNNWKMLVSDNILQQIDSTNLNKRLTAAGLSAPIAIEKIKKIYNRAPEDEKNLLSVLLNRYMNETPLTKTNDLINPSALKDTIKQIFDERSSQDKCNLEHLNLIIQNLGKASDAAAPLIIERTIYELRIAKLDKISLTKQSDISTLNLSDVDIYLKNLRERLSKYFSVTENFIKQSLLNFKRYLNDTKRLEAEFNLINW